MLIYGKRFGEFEKRNGYIPDTISLKYILELSIEVYLIPLSGMRF